MEYGEGKMWIVKLVGDLGLLIVMRVMGYYESPLFAGLYIKDSDGSPLVEKSASVEYLEIGIQRKMIKKGIEDT